MSVLTPDRELSFPHYTILKASAGAGKTRALTDRYVQFILSEKLSFNHLRNILAITFSNNAAREMKERILARLKKLFFRDPETISDFLELLTLSPEELSLKAKNAIEEILNNYSDFQVKTIDSFMSTLFKAGATDFGYPPDFEIVMNNDDLLRYSFDLYLRTLRDGTPEAEWLKEVVDRISESRGSNSAYPWDPYYELLKRLRDIYSEESALLKGLDLDQDLEKKRAEIENYLSSLIEEIVRVVNSSGLERKRSEIFDQFLYMLQNRDYKLLLEKGIKNIPVKKVKDNPAYEYIVTLWNKLIELVSQYAWCYAGLYFQPYLEVFKKFKAELNRVKLAEGKVFMEDINKTLSEYIEKIGIPEIYFRLGERFYHFLIDEFQDTSHIQWANLFPLIENALSSGGSLFVVGDTKQSIYGFRKADYRIMKQLETEEVFPSAAKELRVLDINFRSGEQIVRFNEKIFKEIISRQEGLREAASLSGLTDYNQNAHENNMDRGYVKIKGFERGDLEGIKDYILILIDTLISRGYQYRDIAILAFKNDEVIEMTRWLNERNIPLISFSNLDVRKRKVTDEIIHLLNFLDSPINNFSFAVFISGTLYKRYLQNIDGEPACVDIGRFLFRHREDKVLYKEFQKDFPHLWKRDFGNLFRLTGYLPLYELMTICLSTFRVFDIMLEEEATFIKILELVRSFENSGYSSIKNFMEFLASRGEDDKIWNISLPSSFNAVKLMTVHKAKGLQFPVTVVYLNRSERTSTPEYYIYETPRGTCFLKINKELEDRSEFLKGIKDSYSRDKLTSELNTLYVAFTRAERELYIVGTMKDGKFPYGIPLNQDNEFIMGTEPDTPGFPQSEHENSAYGKDLEDFLTEPSLFPVYREGAESLDLRHYYMATDFPVDRTDVHFVEKQRGEFIHSVLASIEYVHERLFEELKPFVERLNQEHPGSIPYHEIVSIVRGLLNSELNKYFTKRDGRTVKNEFSLTDRSGNVYRPDRIVIDPDTVTVIDYKTGIPTDELTQEHTEQILHYKRILQDIYPSHLIQGFLYYIDTNEVLQV